MKKLLSIVLALILVLSAIPMVMVSAADPVVEIFQDFEKDAEGVTKTDGWRSTAYVRSGTYSYMINNKTGAWYSGQNVTSSTLKNYAKFEIPSTANIVGAVGFYAYKLQKNTSKLDAWGVEFEDGTKFFTKYSAEAYNKNAWTNINFIGKKMYQCDATSVSKTLTVEDFNNDTNKVKYLYAVVGGTNDQKDGAYRTYIDDLYYETDVAKSSYFITIDGEQVAEVPFGETYTIPTPADHYCYTDGINYYYGGEVITPDDDIELVSEIEKTVVTYTMDEGSRVESAATANIVPSGEGEYVEIDGDWKLGIKVKSDQSGYFKLPSNWSNKPYFKPISISVTYDKNVTSSVGFKSVDFSQSISGSYAPSGDKYSIFASTGGIDYAPKTYKIDITEDMYDYYYFSTKFYASASYSTTAPVYALVDNVTITYEYDFDYVEPSISTKVETLEGAQLRLNNKAGIRFVTDVDKAEIARYIEDGYTVEMGTLIAPADKVVDELTFESEVKAVVPFASFANDNYFGESQIAGSIVNIKEKNFGRVFVGRGYVKLTKDGVTTTIYSEEASTRSIKYLANACKNDANFYETLDADYQTLVDTWAQAPDFGA